MVEAVWLVGGHGDGLVGVLREMLGLELGFHEILDEFDGEGRLVELRISGFLLVELGLADFEDGLVRSGGREA